MDYAEHTDDVEVARITPPHDVRDVEKMERLTASMTAGGWQGRPLLVLDVGDGRYAALTGSHRYAAAKAAGLETVPCVVVQLSERLTADVNAYWGGYDVCLDGDRMSETEAFAPAFHALSLDVPAALVADELAAESL